jgi:lysophospholipase L1-like esterase
LVSAADPGFVAILMSRVRDVVSVGRMTQSLHRWRAIQTLVVTAALAALMFSALAFGAESPSLPAATATERWVGTWAAAPQAAFPGPLQRYDGRTLRLVVHTSVDGARVRIRLSNTFGRTPLHIAAAHVALRRQGAEIDPASDRALNFHGQSGVVVAPGQTAVSDPVELAVPALSDLSVSLYVVGHAQASTVHTLAQQTSYVAGSRGDATGTAQLPSPKAIDSWPFLTGVDVEPAPGGGAIVVFGDSWVDGDGSTPDANARWTDALAARLQRAGGACARVAVLNEGLIGNRLLYDSPVRHAPNAPDFGRALGESGLARFDRDVLRQAGVRAVLVHLGTNDIGFEAGLALADETVSAAALIEGYRKLVTRAHRAGLRAIGTTLTPVGGVTLLPNYDTPAKERLRQQVNAWIRNGGAFDTVIDLDRAVRDADHPARLSPSLASADGLHPNDTGYAVVAEALPLAICEEIAPAHPNAEN